jgi:PAS domain S-box-containing protein
MNVIDCKENILSGSVPPGRKEQPADGPENPDVAKINVQLESENARLAQDNVRLEQKYELLRTLIDSLPDKIFIKNRQSRFLVNNLAHVRILGATHQDEVLGKSDLDIFPAELAGQYYEDDQAMMQSGQPLNRKEPVVNPRTGEKQWLQTTKVPLRDKQGAVVGLIGISRDITETKHVEEALVRERFLLRTLIDNLPDGVYIKDTEGRKTMANPADLKVLGCKTEAEAIGKNDFDLFSKDMAEKFWADDQKVIHGEPVINREEFVLNNAGEKRWLLTSKLPLRDQDGKITGLVGIGRDITEQKRVEEALRQSRDELEKRITEATARISQERLLLRTLIDNLPDAVYAKDNAGRKTMVNPADLKNLHCKTEAEAIGKSDFDLFPKEEAEKFWADDQRVLQGQPVLKREEFFLDEKGQKHWLLTSKVPMCDQTGKVVGLVGIGRDITKNKLAEEALAQERSLLRTLIDNLPDAVYAKDTAGRKLLVNQADLKNLHFKTEAEVINKTDFDFFPKDMAEKFWADDQKVIQGEPVIDREEYVLNDAGGKRWLLTSKLPLRDQNGKIIGLVGIGRDITERKQAIDALRSSEAKLRQSTVQLERSNHELQDFAYVASHDLQEPLRKIVVFGERLKEKKIEDLGPEAKDYLDRMQKAAARMQTLINDLLTFSRVTTKARPFTSVNLAEVAADVVNDLEGRIEQVKGRVEVVGTLPVIDAEALQMRQLLQNLMGNALKFRRPEEPPVVKVEAELVSGGTPPQQFCKLMVSDNGIGFDEKYLDRIFNVFQRLHTRNEYEGTGMGLAITKKIALYHGGEITAKSTPGHGATFIVTLPVSHTKPATNEAHNE